MPNDKTISEVLKDSPYKEHVIPFLTIKTIAGCNSICRALDRINNIPSTINGKPNPDSWENKLIDIGELFTKYQKTTKTEPIFKLDAIGMENNAFVLKGDISKLDKKASDFIGELSEEYKKTCEKNAGNKTFTSFKSIMDMTMLTAEYEKGDFLRAIADNPYLYHLQSQMPGGPNFADRSLDELYENLAKEPGKDKKKTEPLGMINEYSRCTNELFIREYEKHKMVDNGYTPEQEKKYLEDLKRDLKATIDNFDKMYKFSEQHPDEYKEGRYLGSDFDHITGVAFNHTRDAGNTMGNIRGQLGAIENGWGMEELNPFGALGELKTALEKTARRSDFDIRSCEKKIETDKKNLETEKNEIRRKRIESTYEDHLKELNKLKAKKEESAALLNDMKELDDTVLNKKVNNAADKAAVLGTLMRFVNEKSNAYPNTDIDHIFKKEQKVLINDSLEKVFGQIQLDDAIKALEDGQKGVLFGKKDYDNVLREMKALNEMYKANKDAVFAGDKAAVTPEIKAKEQEVLSGIAAYKTRKEDEFAKNASAGKQDNANSRKRYNAMDKALNDLRVRVEFNNRLEKGFPPQIEAPQAENLIPDEPQAKDQVKIPEAAEQKKAEAPKADVPNGRPVINEETERYLNALKAQATSARGIIRDSEEYIGFLSSIDKVTDITRSINQSRKKNMILDEDLAYKRYAEAVHEMQTRAKDYEDYKLSDHTKNPKVDTNMKKLNSTDKEKLNIVRSVMHNNRYFNIGEPIIPLIDRRLSEAQEKIRAAKNGLEDGEYPDRKGLEPHYAVVAAANLIKTKQKHGKMMHVSAAQFDSAVESLKKMPAFVNNMKDSSDKTMYEHASAGKGQMLYEDISNSYKAVKAQEDILSSSRTEPNKTIEKPNRTMD